MGSVTAKTNKKGFISDVSWFVFLHFNVNLSIVYA